MIRLGHSAHEHPLWRNNHCDSEMTISSQIKEAVKFFVSVLVSISILISLSKLKDTMRESKLIDESQT
jgi:hypothetical protein